MTSYYILCVNIILAVISWSLYATTRRIIKSFSGYNKWLRDNLKNCIGCVSLNVWVARDFDGRLFAYEHKPFFVEASGVWFDNKHMQLPTELLPKLHFYDEPIKVEIEIRIRETKKINNYGKI